MKILLISAVLCLAGLAHGASIQRLARNTEAIIPTIVEEILKVELQSDLKKNSGVEAVEAAPIVTEIKEEVIVEPIASRLVEEGALPIEEKKPEIVEIVAVKEIIPEPIPAVRNVEAIPEVAEKVEIVAVENVEKPVDNFRTESVPSVEQPIVEIIKETVVVEPVSELRAEPVIAVIKEEEIVKPMVRNVIKEEIPQVEELRVIPEEVSAIKEVIPEPIASSNIVEPLVEVEQTVKTIAFEPVVEIKEVIVTEVKAVPEIVKPEEPEIVKPEAVPEIKIEEAIIKAIPQEVVVTEIKEEKIEIPAPVIAEIKAVPEFKPVPELVVVPEAKPIEEGALPVVDENDPLLRQDRPTIVQQVQDALSNAPIVGQFFNRNPAAAADGVADETTPRPNLVQVATNAVQNVIASTQTAWQNAVSGNNNNAAESADGSTQRPNNPVLNVVTGAAQLIQGAAQNLNGIFNPTQKPATTDAPKPASESDEKEKPVKEESEVPKSVEPEAQVVVEPVVQKEVAEPQKVVEEEKENLVKN